MSARSMTRAWLGWALFCVLGAGCDDASDAEGDAPVSDMAMADGGAEADAGAADGGEAPPVDDPSPQSVTLDVDGLVFDAIVAGPADGPGVVLLHGFPQTNFAWDAYLQPLADAGFRVVAPNQRGYSPGARPEGVEAYALPRLSADVLGIADAMGFDRFHLVGHDWGAAVTWYMAGTTPERLLTITPISVPHLGAFAEALADPESDQAERSSYFELFRNPSAQDLMLANDAAILRTQVWEGLADATIAEYLAVLGTPEALGAALDWYRANDFATAPPLGSITVPTLYLWGNMDPALGPDAAMATGGYVDGPYEFVIVEGASHWVPELNAAEVLAPLLQHLQR